jgi:hypothetical protein
MLAGYADAYLELLSVSRFAATGSLCFESRHAVTAFVPRPDVVLAHYPLDSRLAGRKAARTDFLGHARRAISAFDLGMNRPNERQQLPVTEPLAAGVPPRFHAR